MAIIQSNYIPWKGYFDIINLVDEFILYDHVQYTKRDWRNRNRIKTPNGLKWLTIPFKHRFAQKINEAAISDPQWRLKHWNSNVPNCSRAKYFRTYRDFFEDLYADSGDSFLSRINFEFLTEICGLLKIQTKLSWSSEYEFRHAEKTGRRSLRLRT